MDSFSRHSHHQLKSNLGRRLQCRRMGVQQALPSWRPRARGFKAARADDIHCADIEGYGTRCIDADAVHDLGNAMNEGCGDWNAGQMRCLGRDWFATCNHGSWTADVRACGEGTYCNQQGNYINCGFKDGGNGGGSDDKGGNNNGGCSANGHYDNNQGKCVCNDGYLWNGSACAGGNGGGNGGGGDNGGNNKGGCSANGHYDNNQGKCVCNDGYWWTGSACTNQ
ncbi:hypothetical protein HDU90_008337 [Geranomyces variabilis]|nr:hypothetical protein HDU90_008337 [Geranomyces variabilis]